MFVLYTVISCIVEADNRAGCAVGCGYTLIDIATERGFSVFAFSEIHICLLCAVPTTKLTK